MKNPSWILVAALVSLAASAGVNVLQAGKIDTLLQPPDVSILRPGSRMVPLSGVDASGQRLDLVFDTGRPTVLYYFSSYCTWCAVNWSNVRTLARAAGNRYRLVGLTAEHNIGAFVQEHQLDFEVLTDVAADWLAGTPQTIVVSAEGTISHQWMGAFRGDARRQIERLFDIVLPGLDSR